MSAEQGKGMGWDGGTDRVEKDLPAVVVKEG